MQGAVTIRSGSRPLRALRGVLSDALYRGSLTLLINTILVSAIGFVFWTLAARTYPASTVGVFSSLVSGAGLLAAIAALGLPNTMIRHITSTENPLALVAASVAAIVTVGTVLCLVTVLTLGPRLPPALHLNQRGAQLLLIIALVVLTAIGGTLDAGLIATRATHAILIKNVVGSIAKIAALYLLTSYRSSGLLISYSLGLALTTVLGGLALDRKISGTGTGARRFRVPRHFLSLTSGNYAATIMGILPVSLVPIEVLLVRGPAETARFAIAFLIAGFLNVIPSTVAQVLFAEASRSGATLGGQLRNALRGVYALLLPAVAIVVAVAPFALAIFGAAYAAAATGCLRVLALSALLTGGTYVVDAVLIARDRMKAYIFINGANAALVLGCVWALLPRGLTGAAVGWALAQGASLVLGLILVGTGKAGRHHASVSPALPATSPLYPEHTLQPPGMIYAFEPQIRELLAERPTMPTTLVAERIGWNRSAEVLLERVTELRPTASDRYQHMTEITHPPGQIAQFGVWFPPVEIPVGFGQSRSARQLPVLIMVTGYSRWLSAILIPSMYAQDLFAGLWELIAAHGRVAQTLTWDKDYTVGAWAAGEPQIVMNYRGFCRAAGARCVIESPADLATRGLAELAIADLERSFLPGRAFVSPADFNAQLTGWLATANARDCRQLGHAPAALVDADRQAMLPLPSAPPATGWHLSLKVGSQAVVRFDSNTYSLAPEVLGRRAELLADLRQIRVLCDGKLAASHERVWARGRTVTDPGHLGFRN
jgi:O-antigen/teichoic acid export membrane protein